MTMPFHQILFVGNNFCGPRGQDDDEHAGGCGTVGVVDVGIVAGAVDVGGATDTALPVVASFMASSTLALRVPAGTTPEHQTTQHRFKACDTTRTAQRVPDPLTRRTWDELQHCSEGRRGLLRVADADLQRHLVLRGSFDARALQRVFALVGQLVDDGPPHPRPEVHAKVHDDGRRQPQLFGQLVLDRLVEVRVRKVLRGRRQTRWR